MTKYNKTKKQHLYSLKHVNVLFLQRKIYKKTPLMEDSNKQHLTKKKKTKRKLTKKTTKP